MPLSVSYCYELVKRRRVQPLRQDPVVMAERSSLEDRHWISICEMLTPTEQQAR